MRILISLADDGWFADMPVEEQKEYVEEHPASKYAKLVGATKGAASKVKDKTAKVAVMTKTTTAEFAKSEHEFFHGSGHEKGSEPRRTLGKFLQDKAKGIVKACKHEVREFKYAGNALLGMLHGKKPDEHQRAAIKTVMIHTAMVLGPMAVSGGLSLGLAHALPHVVAGFLEHTLVVSAARAAVFASDAPTPEEMVERLVTKFAEYIESGEISKEEWAAAFEAARPKLDKI